MLATVVSMSLLLYDYLEITELKKMHKKMIWCFSIFMIAAFIAAVAGVAIAVGNSAKYSALEKEHRGLFLNPSDTTSTIKQVDFIFFREICSNVLIVEKRPKLPFLKFQRY